MKIPTKANAKAKKWKCFMKFTEDIKNIQNKKKIK